MRRATEDEFLKLVTDYAHFQGWLVYHVPDSRRVTSAGFPDLVLARKGQIIFAELKTHDGRVSLAQQNWIRELDNEHSNNVSVFVWRPEDFADIEGILR